MLEEKRMSIITLIEHFNIHGLSYHFFNTTDRQVLMSEKNFVASRI